MAIKLVRSLPKYRDAAMQEVIQPHNLWLDRKQMSVNLELAGFGHMCSIHNHHAALHLWCKILIQDNGAVKHAHLRVVGIWIDSAFEVILSLVSD